MHDEREVDVEPARALDALTVGPRAQCADGTDVRPSQQVALDPDDGVVGVVGTTRLRIEEGKFPGPEASVDASPGDDGRAKLRGDCATANHEPVRQQRCRRQRRADQLPTVSAGWHG